MCTPDEGYRHYPNVEKQSTNISLKQVTDSDKTILDTKNLDEQKKIRDDNIVYIFMTIQKGIIKLKEKYKKNDTEMDPIDNLYNEILRAEKENDLLKNGKWFNNSESMKQGMQAIKKLGMCFENNQDFSKNKTKISKLVKVVRNFEGRLLDENFDSPDILKRIEALEKDISQYYAAILILNNIFNKITSTAQDSSKAKRFVSDSEKIENGKISTENSQILGDLEVLLINQYEEMLMNNKNLPKPILSTVVNLLGKNSMDILEKSNSVLGWKDFNKINKDDLDKIPTDYTLQRNFLDPKGVLWTFINVKELVNGTWELPKLFQNIIPEKIVYKHEEKKIMNIIYHITEFIDIIKGITRQVDVLLVEKHGFSKNGEAVNDLEKEIIKIFNTDYKDFDLKELIECIAILRVILDHKTKAMLKGKSTRGLEYVGKWVPDTMSQISENQYKDLSALLDYLSCFAIGLTSNFEIESLVNYTEIKNGSIAWIHESDSERQARKNQTNQNIVFGVLLAGIVMNVFNIAGVVSVGLAVTFVVFQLGLYCARSLNDNNVSFTNFIGKIFD